MLIVINDCNFINLENVGHAMLSYKGISFYLNSGESRTFAFDTEEDAEKAFNEIIENTSRYVLKIKTKNEE